MTSDQVLAEIREANLSYLMLAQSLIRSDREQAMRLGDARDPDVDRQPDAIGAPFADPRFDRRRIEVRSRGNRRLLDEPVVHRPRQRIAVDDVAERLGLASPLDLGRRGQLEAEDGP